ncbi:MAG: hypothetical protein F6J90_21215 [Moorea sp. SIOASIH]|uniref:hypothetical protein n=1 Tax=Moorena sp. SIOASIH TaxID=2607817 RepID=UPI0013B85EC2|nr:hypothetical protein [Moorena sp. SIOASIH]NEO38713.1 hypothetical protein [Moorena sp. SIOASIH]
MATAKMRVRPWVVRYGAGFPNTCYEVEHDGKPAPNAPYATIPIGHRQDACATELLRD